nr:PREDICTED: double-stranded RNA-specific editase 1-like [Pelecanus crispus]
MLDALGYVRHLHGAGRYDTVSFWCVNLWARWLPQNISDTAGCRHMDNWIKLYSWCPEVLADAVARLVVDKFSDLTENFTSPHARRKVLAGIVMTTGTDVKDALVISVSTGTKCINGEYMSDRGLALNDCHAEIISRRCLLKFLYTQLELYLSNKDDQQKSIFIKSEQGGFKLKENVQFHLYISTSPCGDARIFSPHEAAQEDQGDRHPNRKARGQLRTKIESGEGTIPVRSTTTIQTWDGVLQGERLLTMSCSDKIAR